MAFRGVVMVLIIVLSAASSAHAVEPPGAAPSGPAPSQPPPRDPALRLELLGMARDDQESIRDVEEAASAGRTDPAVGLRSGAVHRNNGVRIHAIIAEHGWPGRTLVGDDGAHAAWLVVQHMDDEPSFQADCLALVQAAFEAGEVSAHDLAYLTDRVMDAQGRPQMYGTQGVGVFSREDEARVDRNRLALGLEPWREHIAKVRAAKHLWIPEVR